MQGKKMVLLIILVCVVAMVLVYFWLQDVITKYDLDRALIFINENTPLNDHQYKIS